MIRPGGVAAQRGTQRGLLLRNGHDAEGILLGKCDVLQGAGPIFWTDFSTWIHHGRQRGAKLSLTLLYIVCIPGTTGRGHRSDQTGPGTWMLAHPCTQCMRPARRHGNAIPHVR